MTMKSGHPDDPRALVAEAYAIDGLGPEDARTIFLDWALGLPDGTEPAGAAARLLAHHAAAPEDHPMTRLPGRRSHVSRLGSPAPTSSAPWACSHSRRADEREIP